MGIGPRPLSPSSCLAVDAPSVHTQSSHPELSLQELCFARRQHFTAFSPSSSLYHLSVFPPCCFWTPGGDSTSGSSMAKLSAVTYSQHFVQSWVSPVHWCSLESEGFGTGLRVGAIYGYRHIFIRCFKAVSVWIFPVFMSLWHMESAPFYRES